MTPSITTERSRSIEDGGIPGAIYSVAGRFALAWRYPILHSVLVQIALLLAIVAICAARAYLGLRGIQGYSHDAFMLLDGGWRMLNGQRPHIDFYSHVGVLTFAPTALGLAITHGQPAAFAYGQAISALLLGGWAYLLARRFLNDVPAVLLSLAVTFMAASPSILGFSPFVIASGMTYNRCGYALLALIFVEVLSLPKHPENWNRLLGGVSTGTALALLFYLKITYFVFATGFLVAMLPFQLPRSRQRWTALLVTLLCLLLAGASYYGFNFVPMFKDLSTVAAAKHLNLNWYIADVILDEAGTSLALGLMGAWLLLLSQRIESARLLAVGTTIICAIGVTLILGNYEQSGFPLAVFLAIIVANSVTSQVPASADSSNVFEALVLSLATVFIAVFLVLNVLTMGYGFGVNIRKASYVPGLASPILKTFVPVEGDRPYANFVDDGLALVQQYRRPGESIMSLDFTNPFSYGLGARPAPGGNTVMQFKTTFNDQHRQSAESLFGSADLVALPKQGHFSDESLDMSILRIYGPYLEQHFDLIGQSRDWKLYRRKGLSS